MASSINADNGAVSGSAGLKSSADSSGVLALQTNGTTAVSISAAQVVSFANPITGALNGTVGATTPATGAFTTLSATGNVTLGDASTDTLNVGNGGLVKDASGRLSINQSSSIFGAQFELTGNSSGQAVGIHGRSADGLANIVFGANGGATEYARIQSDNTSSLQFGAGSTGATKMTLNSNGVLALSGASTSATGVGITFPATQSASSDANTLDDYEEGTWTPIDSSGASLSFTGASGTYVKIGSLCYITGTLTFPATASGATVIIGGLPFNPSGATQYNNYGPPIRNNKSLSMQVFGVDNTTFILLPIGNYTTYVANSAMTSGAMLFSFTYRTA